MVRVWHFCSYSSGDFLARVGERESPTAWFSPPGASDRYRSSLTIGFQIYVLNQLPVIMIGGALGFGVSLVSMPHTVVD